MRKGAPGLGKVQLRIMRVLWDRKQATAREITDELSRQEPIAHSTVQTLLRKMEAKGAVAHEVHDRTFLFKPLFHENEVTRTALEELLSRVFGGSAYGLMTHLLKHEKLSADELKRIRDLIEEEEKGR